MMISWTQTTRFDFTKQLHVNLQKPAFGFIQILLRRRKYILGSKNYFFGHKKLGFWTHTGSKRIKQARLTCVQRASKPLARV